MCSLWNFCSFSFCASSVLIEILLNVKSQKEDREEREGKGRARKGKESKAKETNSSRLALCWGTSSTLSQSIFNCVLVFSCCSLSLEISQRWKLRVSSGLFLAHVLSWACTKLCRFLGIHGAFEGPNLPKILSPQLFFRGYWCTILCLNCNLLPQVAAGCSLTLQGFWDIPAAFLSWVLS